MSQTDAPRKARLRDVSRRTILDRTARLLVERGYSSTSLREIAKAVGMKAGSLYYHFDNKESLVEEILTEGVVHVQESVGAALDAARDAGPMERLRIAMECHLRTLHEQSDYASAHIRCFAHVPPEIRHRLRKVREEYDGVCVQLLKDAEDAGSLAEGIDPHFLRMALFGLLNWTLEWRLPPDRSLEDLTNQFYRIVFEGAARDGS
ncbi:MAG: TetR/AcrR family transcriptional regulator [Alphaproteobacteria bacterium]|nr:TetR/AcrR family transcriptional regulator [Alphaproteobacteria bacterium]MBO6863932.1 TetR/AcrR family transcriptional regulator [Alphaproteobacteria bacterium]